MKHVIICRTDGAVEDMILTEDHEFRWYGKQIGADYIEAVHARGLKRPYLFLVDENGKLKDHPVINFLGSWLYETHKHGEPIVGDIVIVKEVIRNGEHDFDGMEAGEADMMAEWLLEKFWEAHDAVMDRIGDRIIQKAP